MQEGKHPLTIPGYRGTLDDLGRDLAQLRYDARAVVLEAEIREHHHQMKRDGERGRKQLAAQLLQFRMSLVTAYDDLCSMWKLCRLHMKDELKKAPEKI